MIDDLNDSIELFKGHAQSLTPKINKLAKSGTSFLNSHTNAPICGPSRASMLMGIYPHKFVNFSKSPWFNNPVLKNTRTLFEQFKKEDYQAWTLLVGSRPNLYFHGKREIFIVSIPNFRKLRERSSSR